MGKIEEDIDKAILSILDCWESGKKCLIILGAGASASAQVPTMHEVYKYLYQEVANTRKQTKIENIDGSDMLLELENRLCALKDHEIPRSIVAMSLGTLQKAHEEEDQGDIYKYLAEVWHNFSKAFVHLDIPCLLYTSPSPRDQA
eukprot:TRINITY_DN8982_c0_g1_i3.p2 TRINITY_DN8982_c0_g1~~TRINITY_DN8982_c0_g1_i3.p2  ORF type:complete len:145 (-),score=19.16 TRINITY_DN8982_c0_g1_i3:110-544(-)